MLSLSRFVNAISCRNVRKLMMSMDDDTLKQMMLNTLSFFLIPKNRDKYLNQRHEESRQNHGILSTLRESMATKIMKYQVNTFDSLPVDLNYHICSFLDPKSVSRVSFTCHSLCKASTEPAARSTTQISANLLSLERQFTVRTMKQCRFIQSLSLNNLGKGYRRIFTHIFKQLVPNCQNLKSLEMDSISDKLAVEVLKVVSQCIGTRNCDLSSLTITALGGQGSKTDIPRSILKNLKTLTVREEPNDLLYYKLQQLWVNGSGKEVDPIISSSITPYLHSPSDVNLKHLVLNDLGTIPMMCSYEAHPIFWLWNCAELVSAELGVNLPTRYNFSNQCQIMLGKPEMRRVAKAQTSFTSLTVNFSNLKGDFDWSSIFTNIRLMYPNLQEITYDIWSFRDSYNIWDSKLQISHWINWTMSFGGLKHIELGLGVAIQAANSLLVTINEDDRVFRDLEVM